METDEGNVKLEICKQDFLNFSQKTKIDNKNEDNENNNINNYKNNDNYDNNEFIIEMTNIGKYNEKNKINEKSNNNLDDEDKNEISSEDNESILQKIEDIQSEKNNNPLLNNDENHNKNDEDAEDAEDTENAEDEEKSTYLIPKHKMISYLVEKNQNIQDKQTIYEYFYESLNLVYSRLSIFLIIISSLLTLVGSLQIGDVNMTTETKMTFKVLVILFSFIITVLSSVKKFMLFKEKIESIGKYMEQLEILIDNINIVIQRINFLQISDQEFFKQLDLISIVVTRTNSKLFNIRSDKYYQYYKKLKLISSKKWEIKHQIKTDTESKYNEFLKVRLNTMKERLKLKKEFKTLNEQIHKNHLSSFYSSNIFTQSNSTENREE